MTKVTVSSPIAALLVLSTCAALIHALHTYVPTANVEELAWFHFAFAGLTLLSTLCFTAPYGRHAQTTCVPFEVDARAAWVLQECPTLLNVIVMYYSMVHKNGGTPMGFFSVYRLPILLYVAHYLHRVVIYPSVIRPSNKMPLHVMLLATLYCSFNGFVQSVANLRSNSGTPSAYVPELNNLFGMIGSDEQYLLSFLGVIIFVTGMVINMSADYELVRLRSSKKRENVATGDLDQPKTHYKIPRSQLFRLVSCPNFAGEVLEWTGYGLAVLGANGVSCGLAGLSFAAYALSNLLPRALQHHRWYEETFGEAYKQLNRKAFFPYIL